MNIGIDIRSVGKDRTGDETYTLQLVKNLANIDRENSYFLYTDTKDPEELKRIKKKLELGGNNFSIVPVLPASKTLWTFWSLPRQSRRDKLDILHVQYITPIKLTTETKIVTTIHDLSFVRYPKYIRPSDLFFLKILIPPSLKHASRVIAVSEFTKREIMDSYGIKDEKISMIHNGGAGEQFHRPITDHELKAAMKKLGISEPYILYVGTLQPRKNIPLLLRGFAALKNESKGMPKIDQLALVIAGARAGHNADPRIDQQLKELPSEINGRVIFPGFVENELLPALYRGAEAFCFPSVYEGFGLPLIEAMACGTPVVCSSSSCLPEIAGSAALNFDDNDSEGLAEQLKTVVLDQESRKRLKEQGVTQAQKYSWIKCSEETLAAYRAVQHQKMS